jgi:hypothetical protein
MTWSVYFLPVQVREAMKINTAGSVIILDEAHNIEDIARCDKAARCMPGSAAAYTPLGYVGKCGSIHTAWLNPQTRGGVSTHVAACMRVHCA